MTVNELIEALAAKGIKTDATEIIELLGDVSSLGNDDIPAIAEMLTSPQRDQPAKGKRGSGKLAKPKAAIQKAEPVNPSTAIDLPTAAQIAVMNTTELTQWVEKLNTADHTNRDENVLATLAALYNRQAELTALAKAAGQVLTTGNQAMQQAYSALSDTVTTTLQGFEKIDSVSQALSGEGASKLAQSFRNSTDLASRFNTATGRSANQPGTEAEIPAA